MVEIFLEGAGTAILNASEAKYGDIYRVTGGCVDQENGFINFSGGESMLRLRKAPIKSSLVGRRSQI
jgi:hypothetical protein